MSVDSIANMLTQIRNAYLAQHKSTQIFNSKLNYQIVQILKENGFLESIKMTPDKKKINLKLKYHGKNPAPTNIKRISKPGCRIYCPAKKIPKVLGGLGISIISTSQGLLTGSQAKEKKLGGEIICEVW